VKPSADHAAAAGAGAGAAAGVGSDAVHRWIRMDDSDVRYVSSQAVTQLLSGSASGGPTVYLMFYRALPA
jgi:hypothetical protein